MKSGLLCHSLHTVACLTNSCQGSPGAPPPHHYTPLLSAQPLAHPQCLLSGCPVLLWTRPHLSEETWIAPLWATGTTNPPLNLQHLWEFGEGFLLQLSERTVLFILNAALRDLGSVGWCSVCHSSRPTSCFWHGRYLTRQFRG